MLVVALAGVAAACASVASAQSSTSWNTQVTSALHYVANKYAGTDPEYGYVRNTLGSISDGNFVLDGHTYDIDYIIYQPVYNSVNFGLRDCLAPSELESFALGSTTFPNPSFSFYDDAQCAANRSRQQLFQFSDVTTNPLPSGQTLSVAISLAATSSQPEPTPTDSVSSCSVTSLGTITSSAVTRSGSWSSSCVSVNRPERYARFYSFRAGVAGDYQIDLTSSEDTYLFVLNGAGTDGSVAGSNDDIDGSRNRNSSVTITATANSYYTVEATTYSSSTTGNFSVTIDPPASGGSTSSCSVTDLGTISTSEVTRTGSWTSGCDSVNRSGRYARFYSFQAGQAGDYEIELTSTVNAYLFILNGAGTDGAVIGSNNDIDGSRNRNSRVTIRASANNYYTIEATTFSSSTTGNFSVTIDPPASGGSTSSCSVTDLGTISTSEVTRAGSWTSGCDSVNRSGRYARFFSFQAGSAGEYQIDLVSTTDPYLILLSGSGTDGSEVDSNDDIGGGNQNSRITFTATANGYYTVEATTFDESATGSFTLTIDPPDAVTPPVAPSGNSWSTYINSRQEPNDDEYGYKYNDFGSIGDRTFELDGTTFTIEYIKWDDSLNRFRLYLRGCLKPSRFQSIVVGSTTFAIPSLTLSTDRYCTDNPDADQYMRWSSVTTNPLPANTRVNVTVNFNDPPPPPPPVTIQINSAEASEPMLDAGQPSTLTVDASASDGGTLSYRWQELVGTVWTDVSTNFEHTVTSVSVEVRTYQVIVTHASSGATATSSPVTIR